MGSCSLFQTKVDPDHVYTTEGGFAFQFPMSGEWRPGPESAGHFIVSKKSVAKDSSILALVRHGPIWTPGGKQLSSEEIFKAFKKDIEKDSQGGRISRAKTEFTMKNSRYAECLLFKQTGEDDGREKPLFISNDGMICLHPKRKYQFIWMAMSQRTPLSATPEDLSKDESKFFDSLQFM